MYQKGFETWRKRQDALAFFQKAVELDQNFAKAYVGLASAKMFFTAEPDFIGNNLEKAESIESETADANAVVGFLKIFYEHDWAKAESALKRAVETDETYRPTVSN